MEIFLRLSKSTNYRFLMFSKLLTRGFSFQFYFLLWEFNIAFSHFWEFFCSRHVNQDVVLKNCLYCSLEKYYFQSLLNGVFINKKRQPSNFRMLDKTEKEPVYYYWKVVYGRNVFCCTCELSSLWPATCNLWPVTCGLDPPLFNYDLICNVWKFCKDQNAWIDLSKPSIKLNLNGFPADFVEILFNLSE